MTEFNFKEFLLERVKNRVSFLLEDENYETFLAHGYLELLSQASILEYVLKNLSSTSVSSVRSLVTEFNRICQDYESNPKTNMLLSGDKTAAQKRKAIRDFIDSIKKDFDRTRPQ